MVRVNGEMYMKIRPGARRRSMFSIRRLQSLYLSVCIYWLQQDVSPFYEYVEYDGSTP
jgi:hypothetical protein